MKKIGKIVGMICLILLAAIVVLVFYLSRQPSAPEDYQNKVQTGGEIEEKYMANGSYEVAVYEQTVLQGFGKYIIYYPDNLSETAGTYPVIVLCNGSGTPLSKYPAVAEHFASWGFLVIGTEEEYDWNGFAAELCIRYLEVLNENETIGDGENRKDNIFFGKIDFEHVGIVGHSQGGVGVINAITTQKHSKIFQAAVSISPANKELAQNLLWDYDATQIDIPIMLLAGAGGGDDWVVTGEQLEAIYEDISSDKIMLRRKDTPHGEMLYSANGYVTAWFMWQLQGDAAAAKAFIGADAEIVKNECYQDQQFSFNE